MTPRIGLTILPELRWREAEPRWRAAEEMGFDHLWTYDHLTWGGLPDSPWYGTVSTLTAAALVTRHVGIGTFVASPNFRHPAAFVRVIRTPDNPRATVAGLRHACCDSSISRTVVARSPTVVVCRSVSSELDHESLLIGRGWSSTRSRCGPIRQRCSLCCSYGAGAALPTRCGPTVGRLPRISTGASGRGMTGRRRACRTWRASRLSWSLCRHRLVARDPAGQST